MKSEYKYKTNTNIIDRIAGWWWSGICGEHKKDRSAFQVKWIQIQIQMQMTRQQFDDDPKSARSTKKGRYAFQVNALAWYDDILGCPDNMKIWWNDEMTTGWNDSMIIWW